ncbi:MAG: DUF4190 domain-containing protein [FCB group bacterium]|jgi:prepilin-type processing-associated H-X9-DG protein|nr:DUF4190 domain-containing protein [FCB group bacterium]
MINHACPQCQQTLQIGDEFAGQRSTCPKCGAVFTVPAPYSQEAPYDQEGSGQAIASLVLGILSFFCLSLLGAVPAIALGHSALRKIKYERMPAGAWGMAFTGLILGYLNVVVSIAAVSLLVLFVILRAGAGLAPNALNATTCQNNLKQMGIVFKMYAGENRGKFPTPSSVPGRLMVTQDQIYPEYLTDTNVLLCPNELQSATTGPAAIDDNSYFYLGYVVTNERDVATFCKVYKERMGQNLPMDQDLTVPMGEGLNGNDKMLPLKEGVERFLITDIGNPASANVAQATIPILIERPGNHPDRGGANVLYMDGHVEFIPYPGKWPMTAQTISALNELDAMGQ